MSLSPPVIELVRHRLGLGAQVPLVVDKIEKGGSDREFHRVRIGGMESLILVTYGGARRENAQYASIAAFLHQHEVSVPRVLFHDETAGVLAMQDLGVRDLWSFRTATWEVRRPLYQNALREVHRLHGIGIGKAEEASIDLEPAFDETLYCWEQEYFFEHCLGGIFAVQLEAERITALASSPMWDSISQELAAWPRVLVHRDFQSQNVFIVNEDAFLIDFQGMRAGLPQYDLASLIYDPYVQLSVPERSELLVFYQGIGRRPVLGSGELGFLRIFRLCAVQRLMQALGNYGNFRLHRGKPVPMRNVRAAMVNLREVVSTLPEQAEFGDVLADLTVEPPRDPDE